MSTTKWQGLWAQERQGFYAGQVIKKADIPKYTRIVLRYNKFYEKGSNRPRFVYCFADSEGYEDKCVPVEYADSLQAKVDELAELMRKGQMNGCRINLPSVSAGIAEDLLDRAIEIIEEITDEKWEFSFVTF